LETSPKGHIYARPSKPLSQEGEEEVISSFPLLNTPFSREYRTELLEEMMACIRLAHYIEPGHVIASNRTHSEIIVAGGLMAPPGTQQFARKHMGEADNSTGVKPGMLISHCLHHTWRDLVEVYETRSLTPMPLRANNTTQRLTK
jgi:hypothetical protein